MGFTPLQSAIAKGLTEIAQLLLDAGADVNAPAAPKCGRTALQAAVEAGNIQFVQLLLDAGADAAAKGGYLGIAMTLLEAGADVNEPPPADGGRTTLQEAAMNGRIDMVQLLLNAGIDRRGGKQLWFETAIELAREFGHFAIVDLLEKHLGSWR
ncbi:ankyrin repeat-containing domain protein [Aspergillus carlsbadensis]|nr:ankyrin repeat-containing domain protein [Aspergillus carlsbadensis]